MTRIHVVAAVIFGPDSQVLIARRPDHLHKGGLWEFPGGKVEERESARDALVRELQEELDITVIHAKPFLKVKHDYPEKYVLLDVWQVTDFNGNAKGNEGQPIAWVSIDELKAYQFPEANQAILDELLKSCFLS